MKQQTPNDRLTDEALIEGFRQNGSVEQFTVLVERYKNPLMNFIFRFTGDMDTAKDILQETFIRVYKNADRYNGQARFSTWIYTIASNLAKTELARQKRQAQVSIDPADDDTLQPQLASDDPQPDIIADAGIREQYIQEALLKMPELYREAVILRDIQELAYDEIAVMLEVTIGTVKSRINRGRSILQDLLKDIYHG